MSDTRQTVSLQQRWLRAMDDRADGPGPALLRGLAAFASAGYRLTIEARNALYDVGVLPVRRLDRPVISVGNLSVGGTGKTVLVEQIARWLLEAGRRPAVLTRGYRGARSPVGSDEAAMLRSALRQVTVEADPDRTAAGRRLLARPEPPDAFILDDGFQHRRLARDLDVVAVDATADIGGSTAQLLPRGRMREPIAALRRADVVVLTRADQATAIKLERLVARIAAVDPSLPVLPCRHAATRLTRGPDARPVGDLAGRRYGAFCGLGNPQAFRRTLETLGGECVDFAAFDDHHVYREAELAELANRARSGGAELLLTTAKDAVKLAGIAVSPPVWAVQVELEWLDATGRGEPLRRAVLELVRPRATPAAF